MWGKESIAVTETNRIWLTDFTEPLLEMKYIEVNISVSGIISTYFLLWVIKWLCWGSLQQLGGKFRIAGATSKSELSSANGKFAVIVSSQKESLHDPAAYKVR